MERGATWEREAVRDQWKALEARRRDANQFLLGVAATVAGLLSLLLALAREACGFTIGGAAGECSAVIPPTAMLFFWLFGALVFVFGLRLCWRASR
ncbi:hypothetical protein SAMN05216559_1101 [Halomicrobium zhouii]|uniref:Uncharacterized protein n=1 Tax=Halomicrobium zhouii TaxID=767519 RepID=A0A1I6KMY9_9EURY|nr:hypothetical protein [Halomicrobium zhouii]SFR92569.1 hypothetical protein SAMN05216559_1101 [Halomicrobium zhouii]